MSLDDAYLLQNVTAGYCGNSPMFWRDGGNGYTPWLAESQIWTREDAQKLIDSTRGTHEWKLWPLTLIRSVSKTTVDIQDLRKYETIVTGAVGELKSNKRA